MGAACTLRVSRARSPKERSREEATVAAESSFFICNLSILSVSINNNNNMRESSTKLQDKTENCCDGARFFFKLHSQRLSSPVVKRLRLRPTLLPDPQTGLDRPPWPVRGFDGCCVGFVAALPLSVDPTQTSLEFCGTSPSSGWSLLALGPSGALMRPAEEGLLLSVANEASILMLQAVGSQNLA